MSLQFKFIPLTFQRDENEIKKQIRNTIILKHFFDKNESVVKLESLIEGTQYGYNASALESGKNKFLRISDITDGKVDWETVPFCDCNDEETYLLKNDDILIARTGGTTGKSFMITNPPKHSIYAGYLIRIRANKENDANFINLFLNSYVYWSQIVSLNEGEFRPSANANTLKNLLLPKCTIAQQQDAVKISNSISVKGYEQLLINIDNALNKYEKCKQLEAQNFNHFDLLNRLRQSILQDAIQGKLTAEWRNQNPHTEPAAELLKRIKADASASSAAGNKGKIKKEKPLPPITENEVPFELPEGWVWCRLGEIFSSTSGGTPNRANMKYWNGEIQWYKSGELNDGILEKESEEKITELGYSESSATLFPKGTLLIAMYGATAGKLSILNRDATTNQAVCGFFENEKIETKYLFYFLRANRSKMIEDSWGMSQPNISQTYLRNFVFPLPPLSEQQAIVSKVETLLGKCNQLQAEIENLNTHSKDLLKALFNETFENKTE